MASEISKLAVYDSRIVQTKQTYGVQLGAKSVTNTPYSAISASTSQQSFNIVVPSEQVFIDRAIDWTCDLFFQFVVTLLDMSGTALSSTPGTGVPICIVGRDVALAPFPLHQCVSVMSATINDVTTTVNTVDVLPLMTRLVDFKQHRQQRTAPCMLDRYLTVPASSYAFTNSPVKGYESATSADEIPNGAYSRWTWTDSAGTPLAGTVATPQTAIAGGNSGQNIYSAINGIPVTNGTNYGPFTLYARVTSTEKLFLPPFVFGDAFESHTGLTGVQNMQLVFNIQTPDRLLRNSLTVDNFSFGARTTGYTVSTAKSISAVAFNSSVSAGAWQNCKLNVQYLTPALSLPLPPRSIVPWMEFPRYISPATTVSAYSGYNLPASQAVTTQTVTLPSIPDLIAIYVKPLTTTLTPRQGDFVLPITNISLNFDNFSGLLASHTAEELYKMSIENGLEMDWNEWSGAAICGVPTGVNTAGNSGTPASGGQYGVALNTTTLNAPTGLRVPLVGGPLLLKPGKDFALSEGMAPGLVTNVTFQCNLQVLNYSSSTAVNAYIVPINSGYLESIKGSSRILKGVLTEQDILSASPANAETNASLRRWVGAGMMSADKAAMVHGSAEAAKASPHQAGAGKRQHHAGMASYAV